MPKRKGETVFASLKDKKKPRRKETTINNGKREIEISEDQVGAIQNIDTCKEKSKLQHVAGKHERTRYDVKNERIKDEQEIETGNDNRTKIVLNSIKGLTKNECVCTQEASTSSQIPVDVADNVDEDAHIQVAEWRLHKVQSPIELSHEESIHHDHFEPLEFHGHWDDGGEATFTNNGFTATLRFHNRQLPIIKGGPLHEDEYVFEQLHFHWSEDDHSGCEHIFEGRAYSMEAHAVHFNKKYANFQEAHDKPDGLSVVAFFIQATDNIENPCFSKLSTAVLNIIKINTTTNVPSDCLTWIKEEAQCKGYYTYQGSLTTEPYTESVTWILYPQPIHVSREQVAHFRSLNSTPCEQHNIKKNVRPIQTPPEHKKLNVFFARSHKTE